jgi:hypothetical protein
MWLKYTVAWRLLQTSWCARVQLVTQAAPNERQRGGQWVDSVWVDSVSCVHGAGTRGRAPPVMYDGRRSKRTTCHV